VLAGVSTESADDVQTADKSGADDCADIVSDAVAALFAQATPQATAASPDTLSESSMTSPDAKVSTVSSGTTSEPVPQTSSQTASQAVEEDLSSLLESQGQDDKVLLRPFQKVAGELFKQWAADGRMMVSDERVSTPKFYMETNQTGQMVAANLAQTGEHRAAAEDTSTKTLGSEAVDGLDFSVRGSAVRISPTVEKDADNTLFRMTAVTGVESAVSSELAANTGGDFSGGDQNGESKLDTDAVLSDVQGKADQSEKGGFSAVLHSQGPAHAASDKPSEVISTRSPLAEKVIGQVVKDVRMNLKNDGTHITMRLDPPELGALKVEIVSQAGSITANLQAGNDVVKGLLETNLPMLKESLAQAGIKVDSFNVSSGADFSQFNQHKNENWQQPQHQHRYHSGSNQEAVNIPTSAFVSGSGMNSTLSYNWLA
jgi:flagellar hook-length control protein FliK